MIPDSVLIYLVLGLIVAILMDLSIREFKTSEPFTFLEIMGCILVWPVILLIVIKGFLDDDY